MSEVERRIEMLEEKIAFQEDSLHKLDDALIDQQQQLLDASRKIELLLEQIRKLETSLPQPQQDERPPHY